MKEKTKFLKMSEVLGVNEKTKKYGDMFQEISIFHKTGHVTLRTQKDKEIQMRTDQLILELIRDQQKEVIKNNCCVFENVITFKYIQSRSDQFHKICREASLKILKTDTYLGGYIATIQVGNSVLLQQQQEVSSSPTIQVV